MEILRKYAPDTEERAKLTQACTELKKLSRKGTTYTLEDIYYDVGLNWWYTAIVAHRPNGQSWHAVCPRDYERIILTDDVPKTCAEIVADRYFYDP